MAARNPLEVYEEEILQELLEKKGKLPTTPYTAEKDIRREAQFGLYHKKDVRRIVSADGSVYMVFTDKGRERAVKLADEKATREVLES